MTKVKRIKLPNGSYFDCSDTAAVHGDGITNIVSLSEVEYNALATKDAHIIYVVEVAGGKYRIYKGSTEIEDSNTFIAQYGVTTAKDIYDAYTAGKAVFLKIAGSPFNTYQGENYQWETYSDWIRTVIPLRDATYEPHGGMGYHCDFETFAYGRSTSDDETPYLYRLMARVTSLSWSYSIEKPNTISTASQDEIDSIFAGGGGGSSE